MVRFSPIIQRKLRELGVDYVEASRYDYPTVGMLREAYGSDVVHTWVCVMVENLNDFCGVKQKMTNEQKEEVAHILMCECANLNIAEMGLFFDKIKRGTFGEYYGVLDTVRTMKLLKDYLNERRVAINKRIDIEEEQKRQAERAKRSANVMSPEAFRQALEDGRFENLKKIMQLIN